MKETSATSSICFLLCNETNQNSLSLSSSSVDTYSSDLSLVLFGLDPWVRRKEMIIKMDHRYRMALTSCFFFFFFFSFGEKPSFFSSQHQTPQPTYWYYSRWNEMVVASRSPLLENGDEFFFFSPPLLCSSEVCRKERRESQILQRQRQRES